MPAASIAPRGADLQQVVDALRAVHVRDAYPSAWPADPAAWLTPAETLGAWVAMAHGRVVGHVILVSGSQLEHGLEIEEAAAVPLSHIGGVSRLFVVPPARGSGVADALLDQVEADAARRGLRLALDVIDDGGPAVHLYERRGWRRVAAGPASWTRPDGSRPLSAAYLVPGRVG